MMVLNVNAVVGGVIMHEMEKINELKEEIWEYEYPEITELPTINYNNLDELLTGFLNLNETVINNLKKLNQAYIEVIGYAIQIEEIARKIQGTILDGGKLVGMIEKIHGNVSQYYQDNYMDMMEEIKMVAMGIEKITEIESPIKNFNIHYSSAREAMKAFNEILEKYFNWAKQVIPEIKEEDAVDQIKKLSMRLINLHKRYIELDNPSQRMKKEYEKFREFIDNKY